MNAARIRWLALIAAILVLGFGYLSFTRTVTVLVDGRALNISTRANTVGRVLRTAGIELGPADMVEPSRVALVSDGLIINVSRSALVQVHADGETYAMVTAERDPVELLEAWSISLGENDRLLIAGKPQALNAELPLAPFIPIQVRRAVQVILNEAGRVIEFESSASTLGEALAEQGIDLFSADRLQPSADTPLDQPTTATLVRAERIRIEIGESFIDIYSAAKTVGEALAEANISLQGLDFSELGEGEAVPDDGVIRITRVYEAVVLEQEVLPHQIAWQEDPETELGETSVIQLGQDGVLGSRLRVRYENGEEVSRVEEGERILVEPQEQLNGYGTQIVIRTAIVDGIEIEYWATLDMYATSYSPCRSGVAECLYGTSTSGVSVAKGVVATYLDWLRAARGVSIYVPGYGAAAFYDVGGGFPDGRAWIDLGYTDEEWVGWSSWVTVYFTTPVPQTIPYFLYQ